MLEILKKNNISNNDFYDSLVKESIKFFSKFNIDDFFSDKVQHIYFYSEINDDSVNTLQKLIMECSKTKIDDLGIYISPKPIVIHLNSPGGSAISTQVFDTIIQLIKVPLCVLIEKFCASAATFLALLAPYRVMIDYSYYLIHDMSGLSNLKTSNWIKEEFKPIYLFLNYIEFIKKRTLLTDIEIKVFLERDLLIDSKYCLDKKIIDRILEIPKINNPDFYNNSSNLQLNLTSFLKKTNLNHIFIKEYIYNNSNLVINGNNYYGSINNIGNINDIFLFLDNNFLIKKENNKPIILHFKSMNKSFYNPLDLIQLNFRIAMIQKRVPIIAFIEGSQSFDLLSTILMCPIRILMKPSIFNSAFTYTGGLGFKTIDIIDNSLFILHNVIKYYKEFSNLPDIFYKEIRNRIINLTPKELLKYNIIHLCLKINKKNISNKDIIKYLQLNNLIGLPININDKSIESAKTDKSSKSSKTTKTDKSIKSSKTSKSIKSN
jgi:ATP-dependent protease ClpP protease subunit